MNLFKKTTASIALVALVSGVFSAGVSANSTTQIEAANALAAKGFINSQADAADYNLNLNVSRGEIAKVAAKMAGIEAKSTCDNSFADVSATTPNTWVCGYAEALLDAGAISANTNFRPEDNISKSEAVKMVLEAAGYEGIYTNASNWQEEVVAFAADKSIFASFTNYNTPATRGFIFETANNSLISIETVDAIEDEGFENMLCAIMETCDETVVEETPTEVVVETPTVITENALLVELSANTAMGSDLPAGADGVSALSVDVTAGSEDVSVTAMTIGRTGFGETAVSSVAVYTNEGRASKAKTFNTDDESNVTFSPAVVIKAGETVTLNLRVNTSTGINGEFALTIKDVTASSDVEMGTIVGNYFDVQEGTLATELLAESGSVNSFVTLGEESADIAKFKLTNVGNVTNSDILISSITLKALGSIDEESELENFSLVVDGNVVSTVSNMVDKYITFNFDELVVADDKNETFTVQADIIGGAGKTISFKLDTSADIAAVATKYVGVSIDDQFTATSDVTVQAGDVSIYSIDATKDEVRADKKDILLGQIKVVNTAGKNLEIRDLTINIETASGVNTVVENVVVEINGTSYDLDASNTGTGDVSLTFAQTDLDIVLPQGTTMLSIVVDTLKDLTEQSITLSLPTDGLVIIETEDDFVADVTPASLSFDNVEVKLSGASVSNVNLANTKVVKGATEVVALQFEVEAANASALSIDEIEVRLDSNSGGTISGADKDQLSQATLYKGSVSDANVLDRVSSTKFASNGTVTFDGFNTDIAADATVTYVVTVDTVDTTTVEGKIITAVLTSMNVEDDEDDTVDVGTLSLGDKEISVVGSGKVELIADSNNVDNKDAKTILAGQEVIVYSVDSLATNEDVQVETVTVTFDTDLKKVIKSAKLYLGDTVVATATNSDLDAAGEVLTFDNISNLEFTTNSQELKVAILTETIGYEKIGTTIVNANVIAIDLTDATGVDSNETLSNTPGVDITNDATVSADFDVVPATVVLANVDSFDGTKAKFSVNVTDGNNTATGSNIDVSVDLTNLDFVVGGNYTGEFKIYVDGKSADSATGVVTGGLVSFDRTAIDLLYGQGVVTDSETFVIEITGATTAGTNVSLSLPTDAATYEATNVSADTLNSNMTNEIDLGSRTY